MHSLLFIEDDDQIRLALTMALEDEGYTVREAPDGASGLAAFAEREADLVLLDLRLPDMNGTDVARSLRRTTETERIPIVALSASSYTWSPDRLRSAGFDGYLQKPIDVRAFPDQVRSFCKR